MPVSITAMFASPRDTLETGMFPTFPANHANPVPTVPNTAITAVTFKMDFISVIFANSAYIGIRKDANRVIPPTISVIFAIAFKISVVLIFAILENNPPF